MKKIKLRSKRLLFGDSSFGIDLKGVEIVEK